MMITALPKVKIDLTSAGRGLIEVDRVALNCVTKLRVEVEAQKQTLVTITFPADVELKAADAQILARYSVKEAAEDEEAGAGLSTASDVFRG